VDYWKALVAGAMLTSHFPGADVVSGSRQGLTLVRFSAQPEPFLVTYTTKPPNLNLKKLLASSRKVDECMPLARGGWEAGAYTRQLFNAGQGERLPPHTR
jgi:hypothetical protein